MNTFTNLLMKYCFAVALTTGVGAALYLGLDYIEKGERIELLEEEVRDLKQDKKMFIEVAKVQNDFNNENIERLKKIETRLEETKQA